MGNARQSEETLQFESKRTEIWASFAPRKLMQNQHALGSILEARGFVPDGRDIINKFT